MEDLEQGSDQRGVTLVKAEARRDVVGHNGQGVREADPVWGDAGDDDGRTEQGRMAW